MLSDSDKKFGLLLAKYSILQEFGEDYSLPKQNTIPEFFLQDRACFITLKSGGEELRGCIGSIISHQKLYENIWQNAKNAAFRDPRFMSLDYNEIKNDKNFTIEISVLTVPEKFDFINLQHFLDFLQKNKPGLIMKNGFNQATFLPDVWKDLPNPQNFVSHLVQKAGYDPRNYWNSPQYWEYQVYYTTAWQEKWINIK